MTNELITFIRARLDEDEQIARAASPGPWHTDAEAQEVTAVDGISVCDVFALSNNQLRATAHHIARHDPARVLAEVDAKRRILALDETASSWTKGTAGATAGYAHAILSDTLRLLALPYADHPDYREEWRP
ncbi:hypothetical protein SAMN02982929_07189 [Saccharopolyspora kobensis]|uniref:Uncharacterized protein n=1 Tax=Saccharopolyspora kobensis TaxID=146035 RepID=A0A1H6ELG5_9PSEU|nr:DUF6221 family protein [Saccharopolyspora kobensis]SEG98700.1 hypothetical protein SAMN02982929_07189 [Saccharopolyspora kobensis]SFD23708.1 hypothetical protein SAMN05216506_103180 [Saccharopolyspora kobensis]